MTMQEMTGSCLCGGIRYVVHGPLGPVVHCHCSMCRKATGAAYRGRVAVPRKTSNGHGFVFPLTTSSFYLS